ncbi:MAG: head GIN domain-containing protein [Pseudomonadota bacterium]
MTTYTAQRTKVLAASAALIATSLGLSGCFSISTDFDGVELADLDTGGGAPTEVALAGPDDIVVKVGESFDISVDGDDDAVAALRFKRSGDSITVGRESDWDSGSGTATVTIVMPAPDEISLAGSGEIRAETMADNAEIAMAGSGKVKVAEMTAESLEISSAGSGSILAAGSASNLEVSIVGSGDVDLSKLKADDVEVSIAGSGDVMVMSDGQVDVSIAGSGSVFVTGDARCSSNVMGSGELKCKPAEQSAEAIAETKEDEAT